VSAAPAMPALQRLLRSLPSADLAARAVGLVARRALPGIVNGARYRLDLRETIQRGMFLGAYEAEQAGWVRGCLRPGDVFVDVGASFGFYTTLASGLVGPAGRVFAFEPSPVAGGVLEAAIRESAMANVTLTRAAVGSKVGRVSLHLPTSGELHSPSALATFPGFYSVEVPVLALDDFAPLASVPAVRLMKIDVEGYEPDVVRGMARLARAGRIENVLCEFNSWWLARNRSTPDLLRRQFLDLGFRIERSTALQKDLPGRDGARFDLQDLWFTWG